MPTTTHEPTDPTSTEKAALASIQAGASDRVLTDYRLRQRDYLLRIARAMNTRRGLPEVLQLVIRSAVRMTNGEAGAIAMQPASGGDLQIVASYRLEGRFEHDLAVVLGAAPNRAPSDPEEPGSEPTHEAASATGVRDEGVTSVNDVSGAEPTVTSGASIASGASPGDPVPTGGSSRGTAGASSGGGSSHRRSLTDDDQYDMLTLPLELADETVGQILVFRTEGAAAFTPLDTEVLQAFADQAAVAVRNAHLHEQLAARERQLSEVVERNPGGILLTGADSRVVTLNPAAQAIVGRTPDAATGVPLAEVVNLEDDRGGALILPAPGGGSTASVRGYLRLPGGSRGPFVQVAVRGLCGPAGTVDSYLADIVDLSSYKEAEDAKTAFLAGLSHELKTPLALIQGYAETLQLPAAVDDPSVFDESVNVILDEAAHLNHMVDELLLAARLQSGALRLDFDLVDIAALLTRLVDAFRVAQPDRVWSVEVADELPPLTADAIRLRQVFQNLLSNAAKYTEPDASIVVRVQPAAEGVLVTVRDTGLGIAAEDHARVFDRFVRATDHGEGAGLGLWMSRAIVEAHGGTITVQSEPGKGSTFAVFVPLVPDPNVSKQGSGHATETFVGCGDNLAEVTA